MWYILGLIFHLNTFFKTQSKHYLICLRPLKSPFSHIHIHSFILFDIIKEQKSRYFVASCPINVFEPIVLQTFPACSWYPTTHCGLSTRRQRFTWGWSTAGCGGQAAGSTSSWTTPCPQSLTAGVYVFSPTATTRTSSGWRLLKKLGPGMGGGINPCENILIILVFYVSVRLRTCSIGLLNFYSDTWKENKFLL